MDNPLGLSDPVKPAIIESAAIDAGGCLRATTTLSSETVKSLVGVVGWSGLGSNPIALVPEARLFKFGPAVKRLENLGGGGLQFIE